MFCRNCGTAVSHSAKFCGKCGSQSQELSGLAAPSIVNNSVAFQDNIASHRYRLAAPCPDCRYNGVMGWDGFHFTVAKSLFIPLLILGGPLCLVLQHKTKRFKAQCPQCERRVLLKPSAVSVVKNAWGG